jgi:hypothetical protein
LSLLSLKLFSMVWIVFPPFKTAFLCILDLGLIFLGRIHLHCHYLVGVGVSFREIFFLPIFNHLCSWNQWSTFKISFLEIQCKFEPNPSASMGGHSNTICSTKYATRWNKSSFDELVIMYAQEHTLWNFQQVGKAAFSLVCDTSDKLQSIWATHLRI